MREAAATALHALREAKAALETEQGGGRWVGGGIGEVVVTCVRGGHGSSGGVEKCKFYECHGKLCDMSRANCNVYVLGGFLCSPAEVG